MPPRGFAFGKERRLRKRAEFLHVQSVGLRVTAPHFTMLVAAQPPAARAGATGVSDASESSAPLACRLGVVTTRKIGNAVARNRIKRVCRECFRTWPDFLPHGVDLVVIARAGAHELGLADVRAEWQRAHRPLLKRAAEALARGPVVLKVSSRA